MLLAPWGDLAGQIMQMMRANPALMRRLVCSPPAAFHAYGIYLRLAPLAQTEQYITLSEYLLASRPRDLLRDALPQAEAALWRALALAGPRVRSADDYRRIDAIMRSPARGAALASDELTPGRLEVLEAFGKLDPLVGAAHTTLAGNRERAEALHTALVFLRQVGALEDDRAAERALQGISSQGLSTFVTRRLCRVQAPPLPRPASGCLRHISSVTALKHLGRRFRNCLATESHYAIALAIGSTRFFEWSGEVSAAVAVEVGPGGLHHISELAGEGNQAVGPGVRAMIEAELRDLGLLIVPVAPERAMYCLIDDEAYDFVPINVAA